MYNVLEVSGLKKTYPGFALQNVSFSLPEECISGFIGANGAGKTTTIRSLLGLTRKDAGSIRIFGKELEGNERELKNRIGVVLDNGGFYNELNMAQMKAIIAQAYTNWNEKTFQNHMERFSLNPKQKISTLSKGMRMQFALALALSHGADLLIMDEPTSGLDPLVRSELMDTLMEYMKPGGKSVFFSTHITSDLDKVADTLILINKGKIMFQDDKDSLLDAHRVVKGDRALLTLELRKLMLSLKETDFGFSGLTNQPAEVRRRMQGCLLEKPTVEEIMLGYLEGGKQQ